MKSPTLLSIGIHDKMAGSAESFQSILYAELRRAIVGVMREAADNEAQSPALRCRKACSLPLFSSSVNVPNGYTLSQMV